MWYNIWNNSKWVAVASLQSYWKHESSFQCEIIIIIFIILKAKMVQGKEKQGMSRDSSVVIATGYGLDDRVSIPGRGQNFLVHIVPTDS